MVQPSQKAQMWAPTLQTEVLLVRLAAGQMERKWAVLTERQGHKLRQPSVRAGWRGDSLAPASAQLWGALLLAVGTGAVAAVEEAEVVAVAAVRQPERERVHMSGLLGVELWEHKWAPVQE